MSGPIKTIVIIYHADCQIQTNTQDNNTPSISGLTSISEGEGLSLVYDDDYSDQTFSEYELNSKTAKDYFRRL